MNAEDDDTVEKCPEEPGAQIHILKKVFREADNLRDGVTEANISKLVEYVFSLGESHGISREKVLEEVKKLTEKRKRKS